MAEVRRNAIVTGSAGGLGRALSVRLAKDGWRLVLADVDDERNRETLAAVVQAGGEARCEHVDVTSIEAWQTLHDRLQGDWAKLDLLVNNAGVAGAGEIGAFPATDWNWIIDVNLKSVAFGCHTFIERLRQNPAGSHVVNIASFAAYLGLPGMAAYCATKAGVVALSETLAVEGAKHNVGVTVVCPGFFPTGLMQSARMQTQAQRDFTERSMKLSSISPDDVAAAIVTAVARKQFYVIMPKRARRLWWFKRLVPNYLRSRIIRKYLKGPPKSM